MSREPKSMEKNVHESGKIIVYIVVAVIVAIVIASYVIVANIMKEKNEVEIAKENTSNTQGQNTNAIVTTTERTDNISNNESTENTESASSLIGKTVEQSSKENTEKENTAESNSDTKTESKVENKTENNTENSVEAEKREDSNIASSISTSNPSASSNKQENKITEGTTEQKEVSFSMPIEGEIIRGFAKDNLVYSETLQEWVVHQAIDIKAESRDVVKATAEGTVIAIKNDPRYGLTVIIEHDGGFKTIYSNLLTAEFVVEGEKVKQGQTIGTIGSSATFEIADETHLHFEMLKDSVYVDPTIYIK